LTTIHVVETLSSAKVDYEPVTNTLQALTVGISTTAGLLQASLERGQSKLSARVSPDRLGTAQISPAGCGDVSSLIDDYPLLNNGVQRQFLQEPKSKKTSA
jgi:hypothetical protein